MHNQELSDFNAGLLVVGAGVPDEPLLVDCLFNTTQTEREKTRTQINKTATCMDQ